MSQAEYASKQVPVLTRLVTALRQIPAVEFAVAKFRSLLRGRTKTEPVVANAFVAPTPEPIDHSPSPAPASTDTVETSLAVTDSVMADTVASDQGEPDIVEGRAVETDAVETDAVAFASAEVEPVAADSIGPVAAEAFESGAARPAETEAEIVEVEVFETIAIKQAPEVVEIIETVADLAEAIETGNTPISSAEPEVVAVAPEVIEMNLVQAAPIEADTSTLPTVEPETVATQPAEADIVAFAGIAAEIAKPVSEAAAPVAQPSGLSEREELIRRRWKETGVRMWNARTHGAGQAVLCIQGSVKLLPPKPGETMPQYDRLEFQFVDGRIVCEGFELDAPEAPSQRAFASAAG